MEVERTIAEIRLTGSGRKNNIWIQVITPIIKSKNWVVALHTCWGVYKNIVKIGIPQGVLFHSSSYLSARIFTSTPNAFNARIIFLKPAPNNKTFLLESFQFSQFLNLAFITFHYNPTYTTLLLSLLHIYSTAPCMLCSSQNTAHLFLCPTSVYVATST